MKVNTKKTVSVEAPKGHHWMLRDGKYSLMKHTGDFVPHDGASLKAEFPLMEKH
jgi:hypothetical protein